ncbi:hypothetical protein BDQ12DRAFT_674821 [Crucibulum laeve]|uniref:DUF4187 domain-containing protein n=1 Tax=Crucibulum laeve TaxID=68775 RepID=A0A5C3MHD1_9AGAR|nr:hypothetical protein BDQ12DRAFT_674821 [Crucibulum laeve]
MSDDEDDYLSDKFLLGTSAAPPQPKTYSHIRKEAEKQSQLKNEQNKTKGRRQREIEAREEGLRKSLFERAKEDAALGQSNKALSIMMKMGFKPGQTLGNVEENARESSSAGPSREASESRTQSRNDDRGFTPDRMTESPPPEPNSHHMAVPLPLNEWTGKKGIGLGPGKRARSPSAAERTAKMAKMADENSHNDFRHRARHEYQERRAEGRLGPAQRTCTTLDEQAGKSFNVLWLNPNNHNTFPPGLIDALALHSDLTVLPEQPGESIQSRLRRQMQADALQEEAPSEAVKSSLAVVDQFSPETLEEATQFLRLHAQDRLYLVLSYLRDRYAYCFWCGVEYKDHEEMESQCPGPDEDDHD